jgi:hypothetical protein
MSRTLDTVKTGLSTEPLVALALGIVAVGGEGVAKGAERTASVVAAASGPKGFIPVRLMGAQVDDAFSPKAIDSVQDHVVGKASIGDKGIKVQVGVELLKLEKACPRSGSKPKMARHRPMRPACKASANDRWPNTCFRTTAGTNPLCAAINRARLLRQPSCAWRKGAVPVD